MRFYCPNKCVCGDISKCKADGKFKDNITFTNEPSYPVCPRYKPAKKKEAK